MSLLLDALKKAEQEKLKAREAESGKDEVTEEQGLIQEAAEKSEASIAEPEIQDDDELELTLDEPEEAELEQQPTPEPAEVEAEASEPVAPLEVEKTIATTSTVSDEALQLLVYKTNKRYRQKNKIIWGSLLSVAIVILLSAGAYYYFAMLDEVELLEHKHRLAMRDVRSEPVAQNKSETQIPPEQKNTVVETKLEATKESAPATVSVKRAVPAEVSVTAEQTLTIQKTEKQDPINTLLIDAWHAYNAADYTSASNAYEKVLRREPKNRDALLGMAAVAMKQEDYNKARESYQLLLKLNPRDQIAVSALANIEKRSLNTMDESRLKFMLQQQPSPHLNFALGNYYARSGRWPEAQAQYFQAWQGNDSNADYVYNLAVSLDQIGKPEQALRFYRDSLSLAENQNISFSKDAVQQRIEKISDK